MTRFGCVAIATLASVAIGCRDSTPALTGTITADGSNTVHPLTSAVVDAFKKVHPDVAFALRMSGTTIGFDRFCRGEVDIQNASRPINAEERAACLRKGVRFVEVPMAFDALTVVVHPSNTWADTMSLAELKALWGPGAEKTVTRWSDVRKGWPDQRVVLYGPGTASGTFDYFTETVIGTSRSSRSDYVASDDYTSVVKGVASDPNSLGYLGYSYFATSGGTLKAVAIAGPHADRLGPLAPSVENVQRGVYQPLSRTLLIYVNAGSLERPEASAFVTFYLEQDEDLIRRVSGIPMTARTYELVRDRVAKKTVGTIFADGRDTVNLEVALSHRP